MLTDLFKILKECGIKSISIGAIAGSVICVAALLYAADYRYMQKVEGKEIKQYQIHELEDKILIMDLRKQGVSQEEIDAALKKRWEDRLLEMKKKND